MPIRNVKAMICLALIVLSVYPVFSQMAQQMEVEKIHRLTLFYIENGTAAHFVLGAAIIGK